MGINSWTKTKKLKCKFCLKDKFASNIKRHHESCFLNPENIKRCVICDEPVKSKKAITCGYACSNKYFRTGPNHGNWKESAYTTTCFYYHKKECVVCGESNIIDVHHLDENKHNNDPSNLIPLCPTHHRYWHSRFQYLVIKQVTEYIHKWKQNRE